MKKLVPALCLMVLLAACGGQEAAVSPADTPAPPASAAPVQTARPTPVPTPEPAPPWWEGVTAAELPAVLSNPAEILAGTEDFYLLAALPGQDIALYGGTHTGLGTCTGVLLRQGEVLTPFDQPYLAQENAALPDVWWKDLDGDGAEELAVRYLLQNDNQSRVYELRIYRPEADGSWSDCGLTEEEAAAQLAERVQLRYDGETRTVTAVLPGRAEIACRLDTEAPEPDADSKLNFQGSTFYRWENGGFIGVYGVGVPGGAPGVCFASVTAQVIYDGSGLTLDNLRMMEIGGV